MVIATASERHFTGASWSNPLLALKIFSQQALGDNEKVTGFLMKLYKSAYPCEPTTQRPQQYYCSNTWKDCGQKLDINYHCNNLKNCKQVKGNLLYSKSKFDISLWDFSKLFLYLHFYITSHWPVAT